MKTDATADIAWHA